MHDWFRFGRHRRSVLTNCIKVGTSERILSDLTPILNGLFAIVKDNLSSLVRCEPQIERPILTDDAMDSPIEKQKAFSMLVAMNNEDTLATNSKSEMFVGWSCQIGARNPSKVIS